MLAALHEVPVKAGDGILVPAGTLHAIGGGILLLELQEPTDLSVLVEWKKFGVDDGTEHLELGWETALRVARPRADRPRRADHAAERRCCRRRPTPTSAPSAFESGDTLDQSFSIVLVTGGEGTIGDVPVHRGSTVLVPYAAGDAPHGGRRGASAASRPTRTPERRAW